MGEVSSLMVKGIRGVGPSVNDLVRKKAGFCFWGVSGWTVLESASGVSSGKEKWNLRPVSSAGCIISHVTSGDQSTRPDSRDAKQSEASMLVNPNDPAALTCSVLLSLHSRELDHSLCPIQLTSWRQVRRHCPRIADPSNVVVCSSSPRP